MKRGLLKKFISGALVASMVVGFGVHGIGTGTEEVQAATTATFDVTSSDFGANGKDSATDREQIQKALDMAKSIEGSITVKVPAGTYYLDGFLQIFSNTHLQLADGAVIKRAPGYTAVMINNGADNSNVGVYNRSGNITLSGGTWDGTVTGTTTNSYDNLVYFGHGYNITIKDTTIQNCYGVHLLELTGVKDSSVTNVTLKNFIGTGNAEEDAFKEAIQLDVVTEIGSEMFPPYDNTPCKNITISGCTISNYPSGVGSHSDVDGSFMDNITIKDNIFEKITNRAIELKHYREVNVSGNVIRNSTPVIGIDIVNSTGTISGNSIPNASENGIYVTDNSNMTISNNTVKNCTLSGIRVTDNSTATIYQNTISGCKNCGIYTDKAKPTINGNTITGCSVAGISVENPTGADVQYNTIKDCTSANGISVLNGNKYSVFKNNVITNVNEFGILVFAGNGTEISGNTITNLKNTEGYGIYVRLGQDNATRSNGIKVLNNKIDCGSGKAGIGAKGSDALTVSGNSVSNASVAAIYIDSSCKNSVITNNTSGNQFMIFDTTATQSGNEAGADGLAQSKTDKNWYLYKNGAVDTSYTGLAELKSNGSWWYVKNGKIDFSFTNLYFWDGTWWYVKGGQVAFGHTGLVQYNGSWYYVKGGTIAWGYTGLANNSVGYFYVKKGVIDWSYTGLVLYGKDWYYVKKGVLDWSYTGLCKYGSAWYYVQKGKLNWYHTGLVKYGSAWYYVEAGKINFGYTGIASNSSGYFYVKNGVLDWSYTGLAKNKSGWFYVKKGALDWSYSGLCKYGNAWYYVKGGSLNWGYTGLAYHGGTYYYVNKGVVDFGYTGYTVYYGKTYKVVKGVLA